MSPAGEKLKNMTGVAAILRFSLPGLDDVEEDDDDQDSSDEVYIENKDSSSDDEDDNQSASQQSSNFDDEQLDLLLNAGMIEGENYEEEEEK